MTVRAHAVRWWSWVLLLGGVPALAAGQDPPVEQGVRIGITYSPGVRPGMLVLGGERSFVLDSARAILARDLDYSDEFEMITLPFGDSLGLRVGDGESGEGTAPFVNYSLYQALGADFAVSVGSEPDSAIVVTLFDVRGARVQETIRFTTLDPGDHDFRLNIHSAADEFVRSITGVAGVASTRLLFINRGRIYRIDSDGADVGALSSPDIEAMSPAWSPDGRRAVYMEFPGAIYEHEIRSETRVLLLPSDDNFQNFTPKYSPDGRWLYLGRAGAEGTDVYSYNLAERCCVQRLTVGRLYDNLSPTISPDGRRIAFVSDRLGNGFPQVYVMNRDGTGQELFAPVEWGVTGASFAPEWSPDGLNLAFHRYVDRVPQVFVMDVASRRVRQLTSFGRNYDPTWAADGRHVAFVSERTGSRQIWIIDIKTGRVRQLTRRGEARLPAWSPRIVEQN